MAGCIFNYAIVSYWEFTKTLGTSTVELEKWYNYNYPGGLKWRQLTVKSVWDEKEQSKQRRMDSLWIKDDQNQVGFTFEENKPDNPLGSNNEKKKETEDFNTNGEHGTISLPFTKDDDKDESNDNEDDISYLPIKIGGGLSVLILMAGMILGYIILGHPESKITNWFASFLE